VLFDEERGGMRRERDDGKKNIYKDMVCLIHIIYTKLRTIDEGGLAT
jgi:hypothetical protein